MQNATYNKMPTLSRYLTHLPASRISHSRGLSVGQKTVIALNLQVVRTLNLQVVRALDLQVVRALDQQAANQCHELAGHAWIARLE